MKLNSLFPVILFLAAHAQNVPKEVKNIVNVLSLLNIKPDSYMKFATNLNETQCNRDIKTVITESTKFQEWALQMLDANGKIPDSLFDGQRIVYGDLDQCLQLDIPHDFQSQFCLLSANAVEMDLQDIPWLRYPLMYFALCLPSTCSPEYITRILQNVQFPKSGKNLNQTLELFIKKDDCTIKDETSPFTPINWITIFFCITVTMLVIASTIYEAMSQTKTLSYFTSFSVLTNGRDIFAPATSTQSINGLRGISACFVITGHVALIMLSGNIKNTDTFARKYPDSMVIASAVNVVDAFLIISAILTVTTFYQEVRKTKSYDPIRAIINRYLRLMTPAGVIFLLRLGIIDHLHQGPIYKAFNRYQTRNCGDSVLSAMLAYDNFKNPRCLERCFPHFWYLSLDMQLFLFTQVLLILTKWKPKILYQSAIIFFVICDLLTFYLSYIHNCAWTVTFTWGPEFLEHVYTFPYTRGVSWFAGILWAGILAQTRKTDFSKQYKNLQKIMWILTIAGLYYAHEYLRGKPLGQHTQPEAAIYSAFHHVTSAIAYGWIIFTLVHKISGPLGVFLSWGPFVFLGNLSYEIYLIHLSVLDYFIAISRHNVSFCTFNRFYYHVITVTGYTAIAALVFALLITRPISNLANLATRNMKIFPIPFELPEQTGTSNHTKNI